METDSPDSLSKLRVYEIRLTWSSGADPEMTAPRAMAIGSITSHAFIVFSLVAVRRGYLLQVLCTRDGNAMCDLPRLQVDENLAAAIVD